MTANLENLAVATGLENVSFHSNPKERQCQRMLWVSTVSKSWGSDVYLSSADNLGCATLLNNSHLLNCIGDIPEGTGPIINILCTHRSLCSEGTRWQKLHCTFRDGTFRRVTTENVMKSHSTGSPLWVRRWGGGRFFRKSWIQRLVMPHSSPRSIFPTMSRAWKKGLKCIISPLVLPNN